MGQRNLLAEARLVKGMLQNHPRVLLRRHAAAQTCGGLLGGGPELIGERSVDLSSRSDSTATGDDVSSLPAARDAIRHRARTRANV